MQGVSPSWVSIRQSKINGYGETNLTAAKHILKETCSLFKIHGRKSEVPTIFGLSFMVNNWDITGALLKLSKIHRCRTKIFVLTRFLVPKELDSEVLVDIIIGANFAGQRRNKVPLKKVIYAGLNLRLVNRLPVCGRDLL
jgi:hypothetical protein